MYNNKLVSVVFATYKEKDSVRDVIEDFFTATPFVDEIIVVNNNAEPGTIEEIQKTKARMVYEKRQGYGYAFQQGMKEAKGDYVFLCEPDGTYKGKDVERFLVYAKTGGFDVVLGSRTGQNTPLSGVFFILPKLQNVRKKQGFFLFILFFYGTKILSNYCFKNDIILYIKTTL